VNKLFIIHNELVSYYKYYLKRIQLFVYNIFFTNIVIIKDRFFRFDINIINVSLLIRKLINLIRIQY